MLYNTNWGKLKRPLNMLAAWIQTAPCRCAYSAESHPWSFCNEILNPVQGSLTRAHIGVLWPYFLLGIRLLVAMPSAVTLRARSSVCRFNFNSIIGEALRVVIGFFVILAAFIAAVTPAFTASWRAYVPATFFLLYMLFRSAGPWILNSLSTTLL